MVLDFGGDDITTFLLSLLQRINFPYKDCDLSRWYDWNVVEELKERVVVLSEVRPFPMLSFASSPSPSPSGERV
jgi:actin-related protein